MTAKLWKPDTGTIVWFACEHNWRRPGADKWQPEYEFMVYQGEVVSYRVGNWTSVCLRYRSEEGPIRLIDIRLDSENPKIFDNPKDAALLARRMTDEYLKHWGWVWRQHPDMPPMPRRWEKYLQEDVHEQTDRRRRAD